MKRRHRWRAGGRLARLAALAGLLLTAAGAGAGVPDPVADTSSQAPFVARVSREYQDALRQYQAAPDNPTNAAQLACACFDATSTATNRAERAQMARQGMTACRHSIASQPDYAPTHYYLGMNMGQLAHTELWSALALVREMEREFLTAAALDPRYDFAGPERNLGLLYLQAPYFVSIGNRRKAGLFLEKAVTLAPDDPENLLNLAEAYLDWQEPELAQKVLQQLGAGWKQAKIQFTGPAWEQSWTDWTARRVADLQAITDASEIKSKKPLK